MLIIAVWSPNIKTHADTRRLMMSLVKYNLLFEEVDLSYCLATESD